MVLEKPCNRLASSGCRLVIEAAYSRSAIPHHPRPSGPRDHERETIGTIAQVPEHRAERYMARRDFTTVRAADSIALIASAHALFEPPALPVDHRSLHPASSVQPPR